MTLPIWIFYLIVGKIVIHMWMQFHLPKFMNKSEWITKLHECDLCSGVWVYSILSLFMGADLLQVAGFGYVPVVGFMVTGIVVSWVVHLFSLGWKSKYEVTVI